MTHDQDLADRLGETLHRRADALHDTPLDLLGRARSRHLDPPPPPRRGGRGRRVRGRRRGRAAVPAAHRRRRPRPRPPARRDDHADRAAGAPRPEGQPPRATDPRVPYVVVDTRQLVTPAATYDLPEAYLQVVPDGDGAGSPWSQGTPRTGITVQMLDSDFGVTDGAGGPTSGLAVREDGGHVAFTRVRRGGAVDAAHHGAAPGRGLHLHRRGHPQQRGGGPPAARLRLGRLRRRRGQRPGHGPVPLPGGRGRRHHDRLRRLQPRRQHARRPPAWWPGRRSSPATGPARASWTRCPRSRTSCGRRATTSSGPSARTGRFIVGLAAYSDRSGRPPSASWTRRRASRWSTS